MALPSKIADFTVLPLLYTKSTQHALYIREHVTKTHNEKTVSLPNGRTLFVVNIPPDATERELTLFFKTCGHVENVVIQQDTWSPDAFGPIEDSEEEEEGGEEEQNNAEQDVPTTSNITADDSTHPRKKQKTSRKRQKEKAPPPQIVPIPQPDLPLRIFRRSGSSAHIVFTDSVSLPRALALRTTPPEQRKWPPTSGTIAPSGLAHYVARYAAQRPALSDVKAYADSFLEVHEYNEALRKQKSDYKKGEAIVDEDGFTLVTRGGAYGKTLGGGVSVASKQFMQDINSDQQTKSGNRGKKKPKKHEKDGFYKFQIHERKRKELVSLKESFEKDKEKIAQLRASRRFKPY